MDAETKPSRAEARSRGSTLSKPKGKQLFDLLDEHSSGGCVRRRNSYEIRIKNKTKKSRAGYISLPDDIRGKYRTPRKSMTMSIRSKNTVKTMHAPGPRYQRRNERTAAQQHCPLTIRAPVRFALEPPRLHNFYRYASLCNVCGVVLIVSPSDKMPCEARMQMRCYFSFLLGQQVALIGGWTRTGQW
ncbi:hypothetical protein MCOR27_004620 [Pyricularia oryzae]|uniref:Uncharacterized protein n=1 Tax=Pyricularia grisea TaxID=148305 RepID=A0ABQ8NPR2_PYRGI|nr:hypothetical protein MCOR27_004620 [Pyricularia oryzae]KAI6299018.1 hypothetical protein MCOR33_004965 [Pyricularia grisea]KAI6336637.1 hypothetical protein MCOR29_000022 [Pyricularia oryzae]KAI6594062.1 hypothetical protein MCOR06_003492 [Pyricularia oryzae]KAI6605641.1 hypothetical protein MCOR04_001145 [Pyricularia oryzae]